MTRAIACSKDGAAQVEIEVDGYLLVAGSLAPCQYGLLLASLAACTTSTLREFAAARRWPLPSLDIYLALEWGVGGMRIERRLLMTGIDAARQAILLDVAGRTPLTLLLGAGLAISTVLL